MPQEYIVRGPPRPDYEDHQKCLGEFLFEKLTSHGNKISQVDAITERSHTFHDLATLSLRLAETMRYGTGNRKWHIGCGDIVGICSENSIDFSIPVLAAFYLGAGVAPLNPSYTKKEIEHALNISKPKVVFTSKSRLRDIVDVAKKTKFVQSVVLIEISKDSFSSQEGKKNTSVDYVISINSLIYPEVKFIPSISLYKDFPRVNIKEEVALVMCSSGTTGLPKGVILTQYNILVHIGVQFGAIVQIHPDDVSFGLLPFFHAYGLMTLLHSFVSGTKTVLAPRFEGDLFLRTIEKHKVSILNIVPPLAVFLAKDPRVAKYDLSSVREIRCGAAPLGKDIQKQVESIVNNARTKIGAPPCAFRLGYGLTESTLGIISTYAEPQKNGSIGFVHPGMQCKIIDLETGKSLGPNKEGELCVQGPAIMKGYLGNPEATETTIDSDGWLRTGDICYYDEGGCFFIIDRLKELIKYKGFQVPPAELEALLLTHPAIEDAGVIGVPDEVAGELPMAMVVKRPGKNLSEADVIKFVADRISSQKHLYGGVRFVKSIPKTASGKILRRELRRAFKSKL